MLALALALLAGPVDEPATRPFALPYASARPSDAERVARTVTITRSAPVDCASLLQRVGPLAPDTPLQQATTGQTAGARPNVKMYHLLDRRIDGCLVPLIVIDQLPQADQAIGRIIDPR